MRHTFYTRFQQATNFLAMVAVTSVAIAFFSAMLILA